MGIWQAVGDGTKGLLRVVAWVTLVTTSVAATLTLLAVSGIIGDGDQTALAFYSIAFILPAAIAGFFLGLLGIAVSTLYWIVSRRRDGPYLMLGNALAWTALLALWTSGMS